MPHANRYFLPGLVWHITHRCHRKAFLLKFARDRRSYRRWVFEAKKRFGLCVLDYVITSNHVHLFAAIEDPPVIDKILSHLGLPTRAPPRAPARLVDLFQTI